MKYYLCSNLLRSKGCPDYILVSASDTKTNKDGEVLSKVLAHSKGVFNKDYIKRKTSLGYVNFEFEKDSDESAIVWFITNFGGEKA